MTDSYQADLASELAGARADADFATASEDADSAMAGLSEPEPAEATEAEPTDAEPTEDAADRDLKDDLRDAMKEQTEVVQDPPADFDDAELKQLLEPYGEELKAAGLTGRDAVKRLFAAEQLLRADPVAGHVELARAYVRTPEQAMQLVERLATELGLARADPAALRGQNVVAAARQALAEERQQAANQAAAAQFQQFMAKPPADLESVKPTMAALIRSGAATSLQDAYDRAVAARDAQRILTGNRSATQKAAVAKAKNAHTPRTANVAVPPPDDSSLPQKELLAKTMREAGFVSNGRVRW